MSSQMARPKMNLGEFIKDDKLRIIVKPNSNKTEVLSYNKEKQAVVIAIKESADKNKANIELIKFLSKKLKRKVRIKSGLTSREKVISIL
ncbi:YggU family protein [Candidatus Woesearchaeota archaeon]|nr:YggU family protein [Candidatus Woesearchaeota archaeon]